jgi:hypothetical protein
MIIKKYWLHFTITMLIFIFAACAKSPSVDEKAPSAGNLINSANGDCFNIKVHGKYFLDSALTADNYIDVTVNIATPGLYDISTNTVDGFVFKGSGRVGYVGTNTVRLYGSGKPVKGGLFPLIVKYGTSSCTLEISVEGGPNGSAVFSLGGAPNNCAGVLLNGTYKAGTILVGNNTAILQVNVTAKGTYRVITPAINGVMFKSIDSVFTIFGLQSITLQATGTPIASGGFNYMVESPSTICGFSVNYQ